MDFKMYMQASYDHLLEKQTNQNGDVKNYYVLVEDYEIDKSKTKIKSVLKEALDKNTITKEEFIAMDPTDKKLSKFYMTFKVHKPHQPMTAPPPRPIISGSGSITENIGAYVEYHIKDIANKHTSYLQDTPHFLRIISQINKGPNLP